VPAGGCRSMREFQTVHNKEEKQEADADRRCVMPMAIQTLKGSIRLHSCLGVPSTVKQTQQRN
jgi:hypothetical protein